MPFFQLRSLSWARKRLSKDWQSGAHTGGKRRAPSLSASYMWEWGVLISGQAVIIWGREREQEKMSIYWFVELLGFIAWSLLFGHIWLQNSVNCLVKYAHSCRLSQTDQAKTPKILDLRSCETNTNSKSSHWRSRNRKIFRSFARKTDLNVTL